MKNGKRIFESHNEMVKRVAGEQGRLLEFRVEEGWGPLCEFLGKEIPDSIKFPRGNDAKEFNASAKRYTVKRIKETGFNLLVGVVVVGGIVLGLKSLWV